MDRWKKAAEIVMVIYTFYVVADAVLDGQLGWYAKEEYARIKRLYQDWKDFDKDRNHMMFEAYLAAQGYFDEVE